MNILEAIANGFDPGIRCERCRDRCVALSAARNERRRATELIARCHGSAYVIRIPDHWTDREVDFAIYRFRPFANSDMSNAETESYVSSYVEPADVTESWGDLKFAPRTKMTASTRSLSIREIKEMLGLQVEAPYSPPPNPPKPNKKPATVNLNAERVISFDE